MKRSKIFISYSMRDEDTVGMIEQRLRQADFSVWRDVTNIEAGKNFSREIAYNLAESDILVLLWSKDAAKSAAVRHEWLTARALEKGIVPCLLQRVRDLPADAKIPQPLANVQAVHFTDFDKGINELINTLKQPSSIDRSYDYMQLPPHSFIPFRPNPDFVGRHDEMLELYLAVIGGLDVVGINQVVSAYGGGGIGKTQLAVEFAYRFAFAFPQGVIWLNAAREWRAQFLAIAEKLGLRADASSTQDPDTVLLRSLQGYIREHQPMLLVMDNVAEPLKLDDELVDGFVPTGLGCTLLFTSRSQTLPLGAKALEVKVLRNEAAFKLLTVKNPPSSPQEEKYAQDICRLLGNLPLAVELAGAYLRERKHIVTYETYLINSRGRRLQILEEIARGIRPATHDPSLVATLESQYELLTDANAAHLFKLAGQFPEAAMIPKARLSLLAGIEDPPNRLETPLHDALTQLIRTSLVEELQSNQIRLHPLVWEFAGTLVPEHELARFLAGAAAFLCSAYRSIPRLEREYNERGIDSLIEDLQVGTE